MVGTLRHALLQSGEGRVIPHNTGCVLHGICSIAIKGDCLALVKG